jgi:hypothetical protein
MNPIEGKRKKIKSNANKIKCVNLINKQKNLINKIHMLIVKKLKLNVNHHIRKSRNHNRFQV